jgi:hypothetical protein
VKRGVVGGGKEEGLLYLNGTVMAWAPKWSIAACGGGRCLSDAYKEDKDKGCAPQDEWNLSEGAASHMHYVAAMTHEYVVDITR